MPSFELAVIDDAEGKEFGWNTTGSDRDLRWVVEGKIGVAFETTYEKPDIPTWREFQCILESASIADEFAAHFETAWGRLPPRSKDRAMVLSWISQIRKSVEEALNWFLEWIYAAVGS